MNVQDAQNQHPRNGRDSRFDAFGGSDEEELERFKTNLNKKQIKFDYELNQRVGLTESRVAKKRYDSNVKTTVFEKIVRRSPRRLHQSLQKPIASVLKNSDISSSLAVDKSRVSKVMLKIKPDPSSKRDDSRLTWKLWHEKTDLGEAFLGEKIKILNKKQKTESRAQQALKTISSKFDGKSTEKIMKRMSNPFTQASENYSLNTISLQPYGRENAG